MIIDTILDTIHAGGWIMWPIIASSVVVWWLGLWQWYLICNNNKIRRRFLQLWQNGHSTDTSERTVSCGNKGCDILLKKQHRKMSSSRVFSAEFSAAFIPALTHIGSGIRTIGVLISVAPLLGLLGTVAGMIETFRIITVYGAGSPALTAEGISIALLTTEAGLTVAFPGMILHTFINNRRVGLQRKLETDREYLVKTMNSTSVNNGGDNV